jgi:dolichol-phosphate mannosyltransferase
MKISVIIPAYNELKTLPEILRKVKGTGIVNETIIVDDGSSDGTTEFLKNMPAQGYKVIFLKSKGGKGRAIREALKSVTGDIVIVQDADLEYDPNDYSSLIAPIASGAADIVYGSRWLSKKLNSVPMNLFRLGRGFLTVFTNLLYSIKITDEPCGYKVFRADVIKNIPLVCERFEFCPEVTAKASRLGYKIVEVPISYRPRTIAEGKKLRYRDGLEAVATLIKYRFWKKP